VKLAINGFPWPYFHISPISKLPGPACGRLGTYSEKTKTVANANIMNEFWSIFWRCIQILIWGHLYIFSWACLIVVEIWQRLVNQP